MSASTAAAAAAAAAASASAIHSDAHSESLQLSIDARRLLRGALSFAESAPSSAASPVAPSAAAVAASSDEAAAASTVGSEPLAEPSSAAASSSAVVGLGTRQKSQAVDFVTAIASAFVLFDAAEIKRILRDAQWLIQGVLTFAEAEVHRYNPDKAAVAKSKMQELAAAKAELRAIPALSSDDSATQRASKQGEIAQLREWLELHGGYAHRSLKDIDVARAAATQQPATLHAIIQLGNLCGFLMEIGVYGPPLQAASRQTLLCRWLLQADALFTRLGSVVPLMTLTRRESQDLVRLAFLAGALQLVPVLMRRDTSCQLVLSAMNDKSLLTRYCLDPRHHVVCLRPYLRLFDYGLDPTQIKAGSNPLSALQLARDFVRDHPLHAVQAPDPMAAMQSALDEIGDRESATVPSVLAAFATKHHEPRSHNEDRRREALHARFMHALIPAWLIHSTKVRSLLLEAAPGRLIPPLVDVVSRYLDLEGVPMEPVVALAADDRES